MGIPRNLKLFLSESTVYTFLNLINKAIPFLLLPIIVRMLTPFDFGFYSLFITIETLLIPIVSINLPAALSRHFYLEDFRLKEYLSTLIISISVFTLIVVLIQALLPNFILQFLGLSSKYLILATICASISSIFGMVSNLFRLQRKPWVYGLFIVFQSILLFLFIYIYCLIDPVFNMAINGRVVYSLLIFIFILIFLKYKYKIELRFNKKTFYETLKFSLPTLIYSLSAFVFLSSDRFFIKYYLGLKSVGFYSAVFQLSSIISILGMSINAAWMPWLFENLNKKNDQINLFVVKISYLLIFFFVLAGMIFLFLFPLVSKLILPVEYHTYIYISIPIVIGFVFEGIYLIVSPYLFYVQKTKYNGYIGFIIALLNVLLNIILIPFLGLIGAAIATCLSWVLLAIIFFIFSYRLYPMPWLYFLSSKTK